MQITEVMRGLFINGSLIGKSLLLIILLCHHKKPTKMSLCCLNQQEGFSYICVLIFACQIVLKIGER